MTSDYTIIFELVNEESNKSLAEVQSFVEARESSEIAELAKYSESIREPDSLTFMVG